MTKEPKAPHSGGAEAPDAVAPKGKGSEDEVGAPIPEEAFYSPDDPIVNAEGNIPEGAFYSPDDPLVMETDGDGVVTGMDGADARSLEKGRGLAWEIMNTAAVMERLGRELRDQGMEALRIHPETEPMEAMLRGFVAGFLVGKIEDED